MLKEKLSGFKFLFSDREFRGTAIITFICTFLMISVQYLFGIISPVIPLVFGIIAIFTFQYIFGFLMVYNIGLMFGGFRKRVEKPVRKRNFWIARGIVISLTVLGDLFLVHVWLAGTIFVMGIAFIVWVVWTTFFFCKMAYEISDFSKYRFPRFLLYVLITGGYSVYLILSFGWSLVKNSSQTSIQETTLDWVITLAMFFFSLASLGDRFSSRKQFKELDFENYTWKDEAKLRNAVLFILLFALGFQSIVRVLNLFQPATGLEIGNTVYYGTRLFFFVPFMIIYLFVAIFKRPKKKPKKGTRITKD